VYTHQAEPHLLCLLFRLAVYPGYLALQLRPVPGAACLEIGKPVASLPPPNCVSAHRHSMSLSRRHAHDHLQSALPEAFELCWCAGLLKEVCAGLIADALLRKARSLRIPMTAPEKKKEKKSFSMLTSPQQQCHSRFGLMIKRTPQRMTAHASTCAHVHQVNTAMYN